MDKAPELPLYFEHSLFINAAFPLPSSNARRLLPDDVPLHLIEVFPGRAVLVVSFALYRESPFGTHAEATLAIMASHESTTPVMTLASLMQASRYPAYVLHMLVNNEESQRLGVEIWSLPREMATVDVDEGRWQTIGSASIEGQTVVQLIVDRPATDRTRRAQIETYSQGQDTLLHTTMVCNARAYGSIQGDGATLIWGDHPIGQRFGGGRISTMPLMVRYYEQMQAELHAPVACAVTPAQ